MTVALSSDSLRIEGTLFPDNVDRFSAKLASIQGLTQYRWDDGSGTGTVAHVTAIMCLGGAMFAVLDDYDTVYALVWPVQA